MCTRQRAFTLIELMIVVAIIGMLSAVAIPSFVKYVRRSKSTEPMLNLRKLFDASVFYFASEHANTTMVVLPKTFPATVLPAPGLGICCLSPGRKCSPNNLFWTAGTWKALHFSVDDPFYFSYAYTSSGQDATAQFRASAHGDLNCNVIYSTYERAGSVDANLNVSGTAGIYIKNDNE
jgi:prepilin-type N-terminal cleavage/methylation domain-containing protein